MTNVGKLIIAGVVFVLLAVVFLFVFDTVHINGHSVGVKESWGGGVQEQPMMPRTYFVMPWERVYVYHVGTNVFEMSDREPIDDSYLVQSSDSQDMRLSLQTQWRISPEHVVSLHKTVGNSGIEERVLRPALLRIVKDKATVIKAEEAYSGTSLVKLQSDIESELSNPEGELANKGIVVDSFVIQHCRLSVEYVKEIELKQLSKARQARAVEEEKANVAEALVIKAKAQADLNKQVVEAERDKQVAVLKAEAENEKKILESKADKQQTVLKAEGLAESAELEAKSIKALGEAKAAAEQLKYAALAGPGADNYTKMEVAKALGNSFSGVKGYLPENMTIFTLGENFSKAVESFMQKGK